MQGKKKNCENHLKLKTILNLVDNSKKKKRQQREQLWNWKNHIISHNFISILNLKNYNKEKRDEIISTINFRDWFDFLIPTWKSSRRKGKRKKQKATPVTPTAIVLHASLICRGHWDPSEASWNHHFGYWMMPHTSFGGGKHCLLDSICFNLIFLFTKLSYCLQWHLIATKWPHLNEKRASESYNCFKFLRTMK